MIILSDYFLLETLGKIETEEINGIVNSNVHIKSLLLDNIRIGKNKVDRYWLLSFFDKDAALITYTTYPRELIHEVYENSINNTFSTYIIHAPEGYYYLNEYIMVEQILMRDTIKAVWPIILHEIKRYNPVDIIKHNEKEDSFDEGVNEDENYINAYPNIKTLEKLGWTVFSVDDLDTEEQISRQEIIDNMSDISYGLQIDGTSIEEIRFFYEFVPDVVFLKKKIGNMTRYAVAVKLEESDVKKDAVDYYEHYSD